MLTLPDSQWVIQIPVWHSMYFGHSFHPQCGACSSQCCRVEGGRRHFPRSTSSASSCCWFCSYCHRHGDYCDVAIDLPQ